MAKMVMIRKGGAEENKRKWGRYMLKVPPLWAEDAFAWQSACLACVTYSQHPIKRM